MITIPLGAEVECADGRCGRSSHVIFSPTTQQVTHIVVREKKIPHIKRLVSMDWIVETSPDLIVLHCTWCEIASLEPFIETQYIQVKHPDYRSYPYLVRSDKIPQTTEWELRKYERIPRGAVAVHRGVQLEATDGRVGRIKEFLVDQVTWNVTHLVLQKGHLWGRRELIIPISHVDRVQKDTIFMKNDKKTIESFSALIVER